MIVGINFTGLNADADRLEDARRIYRVAEFKKVHNVISLSQPAVRVRLQGMCDTATECELMRRQASNGHRTIFTRSYRGRYWIYCS